MSKIVIEKKQAEKEFDSLCDYWEIDIDNNDDETSINKEKIVNCIMRGRLTFDEKSETFKYKLRKPVAKENGELIEGIVLKEPSSQALISSKKDTNEMQLTMKMLSNSSGLPIGVIERIGMKDITVLGCIMVFFG